MSALNALLVHPSPDVRNVLRSQLREVDFLQVLGEAVSAEEALTLLEAIPYGVFFVGVELEGGTDGFDLAKSLQRRRNSPATVFIAADESQAFAAFELGATDYLLWPWADDRLKRTIDRLRQFKSLFNLAPIPLSLKSAASSAGKVEMDTEQTLKLQLGEEEEESFITALRLAWDQSRKGAALELEKLAIHLDGRTILAPYNQIIFIEAYEDYCYVHTANQKFLTSYRMKSLEDRLRPHRFFRVHRKYLVNLDMVTEIASLPGSNFMLRTAGRTRIELPISRRRINELKQILGL